MEYFGWVDLKAASNISSPAIDSSRQQQPATRHMQGMPQRAATDRNRLQRDASDRYGLQRAATGSNMGGS